jgi:hypothetical protein
LLDAAALDDMLRRATPKVTFRDRKRNRDWAALIDVLNEAKGYEYLVSRGYSHIRYLPNSNVAQSPDLLAESPEPGALLEVKSIHQSDCDIAQLGKIRSAAYQISDGLKRKIVSDYKKAIDQCAEVDPSKTRKWFLFLCIDVDSDIACVPSNIPDLDRFIKEMSTDQCEIAYESGIWG